MKKKINLTSLRQSEMQKDEMHHLLGGDDPELASGDQCRFLCSCSSSCPPDVLVGPPESAHNVYLAKESKRTGGLMKSMYNWWGMEPTISQ